jgi:phosphoglycerate dehydrogenase-like enzyme
LKAAESTRYPDTSASQGIPTGYAHHHEEAAPPHHRDRTRGCCCEESASLLSLTLFCSETALEQYGSTWRGIDSSLQFLTLPHDRKLDIDEIARIDLAVFSTDLWASGQGPSFFKVLLQAPQPKWLHVFAAGTDNPVFEEVRRRSIRLTNSAGSSATPIAHTVIMHVLALTRAARTVAVAQSSHEWAEQDVVDVEGRTLGIIGLGSIGAEVARLAQHFGMRAIGMRRTPRGDEPCETWSTDRLHELLPMVDTLVLTAPRTPETIGMIGAQELAMLPVGAHVVNVGRGQVIDEPALAAALASGHIGGAALDVFVVEPLPAESPLWDLPNVIITPHSAGTTPLANARAAEIFAENLGRFLRGEALRNEVA